MMDNPEAGDTLEGIATWWVKRGVVALRINDVVSVVEDLLRDEILVVRTTIGGPSVYRLNKEKISHIIDFLSRAKRDWSV